MTTYQNRQDAGKILANYLRSYANRTDVIVLALPRGGVPVAFEVANALNVPLDVYLVRKLGVPGHHELAMGALTMDDITVFNEDIISSYQITYQEIDQVIEHEQQELKRRAIAYRGDRPFPSLSDKMVILVDDGIATGATIRVAIKAINQLHPKKLIVAVPVAQKKVAESISQLVNEFICPLQPETLYAVGEWYNDFSQTDDMEVTRLLKIRNDHD